MFNLVALFSALLDPVQGSFGGCMLPSTSRYPGGRTIFGLILAMCVPAINRATGPGLGLLSLTEAISLTCGVLFTVIREGLSCGLQNGNPHKTVPSIRKRPRFSGQLRPRSFGRAISLSLTWPCNSKSCRTEKHNSMNETKPCL